MLRSEGVPVHFLDVSRTFRLLDAARLLHLLRRERVDVLHTHTALAANVLSRVAGRLAGAKVISHMHIENHFRRLRLVRAVHRLLDNRTARLCARILAVSDQTRRSLEAQGVPGERLETVYNGIDAVEVAERPRVDLRGELGLSQDATLVGTVGRLCAVKGQRELIQGCALLGDRLPELHVVLIGDDLEAGGAYRRSLETEAEALGVAPRVHLLGYRPDATALLAELDVFTLPSWIEGFPLVVLEAMALSRPVIATAVGGTPELVTGETGLLVPPRDPRRLADAIAELLAERGRAERMGAAGLERVRTSFSAERMTDRVLTVYDEVVEGSRP
jgi:glycosyltransferase involved in cell wall biosynthesis